MFLTEYDKEREFELLRREERREAIRETENTVREEVAKDMLKKNYPLDAIKDISRLSEFFNVSRETFCFTAKR